MKDLLEHERTTFISKSLISKNRYTYDLVDIVNKCNNTYHSAIKMKPVDIKSSTCINFKIKIT